MTDVSITFSDNCSDNCNEQACSRHLMSWAKMTMNSTYGVDPAMKAVRQNLIPSPIYVIDHISKLSDKITDAGTLSLRHFSRMLDARVSPYECSETRVMF